MCVCGDGIYGTHAVHTARYIAARTKGVCGRGTMINDGIESARCRRGPRPTDPVRIEDIFLPLSARILMVKHNH